LFEAKPLGRYPDSTPRPSSSFTAILRRPPTRAGATVAVPSFHRLCFRVRSRVNCAMKQAMREEKGAGGRGQTERGPESESDAAGDPLLLKNTVALV
jgi:hypothetical protein